MTKSATTFMDPPTAARPFDVARIRADFPILSREAHERPLVYLDNAATSQKPRTVLDALNRFYTKSCSNVHRGVHLLSEQATKAYEDARVRVQRHLGAALPAEIIFVRGTTEAINLVAQSYGRSRLAADDEIVLTHMEHHSNIVPWQIVAEQTGARIRVVPINDAGELEMGEWARLLGPRTRIVAIAHVSNALGTINPVREMISMAHDVGAVAMVDGAQAIPHLAVDVRELDCDFYAFSGHKAFGPTGVGVLYGKKEHLDSMPPYQGGGDMIKSVTFEKTLYNVLPYKFEAGTPHVAGAIGLAAALGYLDSVGLEAIEAHEHVLLDYGTKALASIPGLRLIGTARRKAAVLSFVLDEIHAHDVGTILDQDGIAVRTGHHCAQPVMDRFGVPATARASLAFYNTTDEIDALVDGLYKVKEVFA